jgi:hypothetical protein
MSGAKPLLPLYFFMAWTRGDKNLIYVYLRIIPVARTVYCKTPGRDVEGSYHAHM